jgi:hypothetical protein
MIIYYNINHNDTPYGCGLGMSKWMRLLKERLKQRQQEKLPNRGWLESHSE